MQDISSAVPGIRWPAIPNPRGAQLLSLEFQLDRSQWFSPEILRQQQFRQIAVLLEHAYRTVPYYRRKLNEIALVPNAIQVCETWSRFPILKRHEIQAFGSDVYSSTQSDFHGRISSSVTSGSTGQPITALATDVTRLFWVALLLRQHLWHRRDFRLKMASIRSMKRGSTKEVETSNWGLGTLDLFETGSAASLEIHSSLDEQVEFLLRHDPDYLLAYPSVVQALAEFFAASNSRLTRLREVRTFGEALEPKVRTLCRTVWGVPVVDEYSAQEVGHIASQCPENEHYHVHDESLLVEVLDEDDRPCRPGEVGRVVITSLHNFAMPLIRYEIGDYAEVGGPCSCGRGLTVLKRILGRRRNMFILPDGRRVWPATETTPEREATRAPPIQQYQMIQRSLNMVELLVVTPRDLTQVEQQYLCNTINQSVDFDFEQIKITRVTEIPRSPTGKYEDARCEVELPSTS